MTQGGEGWSDTSRAEREAAEAKSKQQQASQAPRYTVFQPGRAPFQTNVHGGAGTVGAAGEASYDAVRAPGNMNFQEWKKWRDEQRNPAIQKQQQASAQADYSKQQAAGVQPTL